MDTHTHGLYGCLATTAHQNWIVFATSRFLFRLELIRKHLRGNAEKAKGAQSTSLHGEGHHEELCGEFSSAYMTLFLAVALALAPGSELSQFMCAANTTNSQNGNPLFMKHRYTSAAVYFKLKYQRQS